MTSILFRRFFVMEIAENITKTSWNESLSPRVEFFPEPKNNGFIEIAPNAVIAPQTELLRQKILFKHETELYGKLVLHLFVRVL